MEYNTKVEGHRGEAARLEQMAQDLLRPVKERKIIALELRTRAEEHLALAQEAAFQTYAEEMFACAE